jgi:ABC-type amino acid transport substrate-binding protein
MTCAFLWRPIRFASGVFTCLLLVALISRANAETPTRLDAIIGAGVLRVGLTEDYRPFSFAATSDKVEGIDVDRAMSLAQSLGVKLDIVKTSWSTLKSDLEANGFDIAMGGVTITFDRQKIGLFSNHVFSSRQDADHALWRRKEIRNDRSDRPARRTSDRQSGRNQ